MKLPIQLLKFLTFLTCCCSCATWKETAPTTVTIIPIKRTSIVSITERSYLAVQLGDSLSEGKRGRRYDFESDFSMHFDTLGRIAREVHFNSNDSFKYEVIYRYSKENDSVFIFRRDTTQSDFRLDHIRYIDSNGIVTTYSAQAWQYYYKTKTKGRRRGLSQNYRLNKSGYNSKFQADFQNIGRYELIHSFRNRFDRHGNLKRSATLNPDNTLWSSSKRKFDTLNNEIERLEYFPAKYNKYRMKDEKLRYSYQYFYNRRRDWIKRFEYKENLPEFIVMREITYY